MDVRLTRREIRRLLAALCKAECWDDTAAQSMEQHDGTVMKGWSKSHRRARRSHAANLRLQSKLREFLKCTKQRK